mmetsp:Transcript_42440/g.111705  ORF Transcript_42440/g.111705 Transcript_42440/m.111705 type:complete len:174 (-) Transcript_42440:347-868(-)
MAASTALHLRVGDVNCGTQLAERTRRPFPPQFYASKISTGMRVYIFAAAHFNAASSHTSHSCENATRQYVQQVLTVSNGTLAPAASVDCDLCSMVAAKHFIQGQGCFSATVAALRMYYQRSIFSSPGIVRQWCNETIVAAALRQNATRHRVGSRPTPMVLNCSAMGIPGYDVT